MAHLQPEAQYFTLEDLEELRQREGADAPQGRQPGWYGRLSTGSYVDGTEWRGPFENQDLAVRGTMEFYDVDEDGNSTLPKITQD